MVKIPINPHRPWVIAHRGAFCGSRGNAGWPSDQPDLLENSAAALAKAVALGVDASEVDIRISGDGVAMLCHDNDLSKLVGVDRWIGDCSAQELQSYGLLPLADAISQFGALPLFLEMKDEPSEASSRRRLLVEQTVKCAAAAATQPFLLSFSDALLQWAAEFQPRLLRGRNMDQADLHPYDFLSCRIDGLNPDFVAAAHDAEQAVITWTVNTQAELNHALRCGTDGIISDRVDWLKQQLV